MSNKVRDCEQCGKQSTADSAFRCAYCSRVLCYEHACAPEYSACAPCIDKQCERCGFIKELETDDCLNCLTMPVENKL